MPSKQTPGQRDVITLKEYIDTRLCAMDNAVRLAAEKLEVRLEGMNEFRGTINDQSSKFITRQESSLAREAIIQAHKADIMHIETEIEQLKLWRAELGGKASQHSVNVATWFALVAALISVLGLVVSLIELVMR